MVPERLLGGIPQKPDDIYALGMTTYEIFTDEIPLGHVNYGDFIELVTKQEVRPQRPDQAHDLSNPIWGLAKQCWVKDPKERPTAIAVSDVIAQLQDAHTKHRKESRKEEARHKEADAQRSKEVVISTEEGWRIREVEVNRREEEIERMEQNVQCKETEAQRKAEETQKLVIQLVMKEDECRRKEAHLRRREEIVERKELEAQRRMEEAETMKKGVVMIEAKIERREEEVKRKEFEILLNELDAESKAMRLQEYRRQRDAEKLQKRNEESDWERMTRLVERRDAEGWQGWEEKRLFRKKSSANARIFLFEPIRPEISIQVSFDHYA